MTNSRGPVLFTPFIRAFGGVERLLMDLNSFLRNRGFTPTIACFESTVEFSAYTAETVRVQEIACRRAPLSEARALRDFLGGGEVIGKPLLFDLKSAFYAALARARGYGLHLTDPPSLLPADVSKSSFSVGDVRAASVAWPTRLRAELVHRLNRNGVTNASPVIVMTQRIASEVRELYGVVPLVVRPGVTRSAIQNGRSKRRSDSSSIRFLSVSRLEPTKRVDIIIRALAKLHSAGQKWTLDVVGSGSALDSLRALAQDLGLLAHVRFSGFSPEAIVDEKYSTSDIFVMPATQGYGLPALESLARGTAVVMNGGSGVAEILSDHPAVEIARSDSLSDLAEAMERMAKRVAAGINMEKAPHLPTSDEWAEEISHALGWMS